MAYNPENPIIIQSDKSVLLETGNPKYEESRDYLSRFAELEKSPEYIHTYRITPLSLWNAAASGMELDEIIWFLKSYSKYDVPSNVIEDIKDYTSRYGRLKLIKEITGDLILESEDDILITEIFHHKSIRPLIEERLNRRRLLIKPGARGYLKQNLIKIGYPVEDFAGYVKGSHLDISFRPRTRKGRLFQLRKYQEDAINAFYAGGSNRGGSGVLVLPCGAGKTIIGMGIMEKIKMHTLILGTNVIAIRQWRDELLDKTTIDENTIGEYTGEVKEICPVTLSTYQILTYRYTKKDKFLHFSLFDRQNWGLIIYDEVHLLPAPIFRAVANLQAKRRLGLTATLIREDGKEEDVFSLIGPKKYDVPWKTLESQGWIAKALCKEIRIPFSSDEERLKYAVAHQRSKFRLASTNEKKFEVVFNILKNHKNDNILIIGQYLDQLKRLADKLNAPIITGQTANVLRENLYNDFRKGKIKILIVSKVANFAIDLPDANVAIQISGTFGSRQEEAQRLGRILRPKKGENYAYFYSIITKDTKDQDYSANRQLFLTEQGYKYKIENI